MGLLPPTALFQNEDNEKQDDEEEEEDDSGTDCNSEKSGTLLQRCERHKGKSSTLPDTFQTSNLLFYERFKAYQDYMLGNSGFKRIGNHSLPAAFQYIVH